IGKQQVPSLPPPSDGRRDDVNQQSTTKFASSTPIAPSDTPVTTLGQVGANTKNPAEVAIEDAIAGTSTSSTSSNQPKSGGTAADVGANSNQANAIDTSAAPDISLSHSSVAENTSAGTLV